MREVSCKAVGVMLSALKAQGRSPELMTAGTSLQISQLTNPNERISWDDYLRVAANCRSVWAPDDFVAVGRDVFSSPIFRYLAIIARVLFSAEDFYRWLSKPGDGGGNQTFTCINPGYEKIGPNRLRLTLQMKPGYEPCEEFFLISKGSFIDLPKVVGRPSAVVQMTATARGAVYDVTCPPGVWTARVLRKIVTWPVSVGAAARELKSAHEALLARYQELDDIRNNLEVRVKERTAELEESNRRLATSLSSIQEAQEARDRIFANINHEIRTPLSLITLNVSEIARNLDARAGDAGLREYLEGIDGSTRQLLHLVDGLLLLAARQESKLRLAFNQHDIVVLLRRVVATWRATAAQVGLTLTYEGLDRCVATYDENAIGRVLTNLVSNAIKFTPRGGSVEIQLIDNGDKVAVRVRDTGVGIDDEFKKRIFGRFEQGRPAVRSGSRGSGIGLAIVKELAEAHGGSATVASNPGGGSVFEIVLPKMPPVHLMENGDGSSVPTTTIAPDVPKIAAHDELTSIVTASRESRATILIAEDDPDLRAGIARLLRQDYNLLLAPDGLAALRLAKEHHPDILVSDIGMPGMDGIELTRRFRELGSNRIAPVILLTAFGDIPKRLEGLAAGAIDYVLKPFQPDELRARVRAQLMFREVALKLHESEKLASLGVLSAGLAHELRNPANGVVNAIAPLRDLLPAELTSPGTPTAELLDVITSCSTQIATLSRQLLGMTRPGQLQRARESLGAIVDRSLAITASLFSDVQLDQSITYRGDVQCAGPLVVQAITNLLENAAHAAGKGGKVRLSTRRDGANVIIDVSDSGPGVPRDLRARIFDPFFTTKAPGAGTGLGLSTSRQIIERQGGSLSLLDTSAETTFRIELPDSVPLSEAATPRRAVS